MPNKLWCLWASRKVAYGIFNRRYLWQLLSHRNDVWIDVKFEASSSRSRKDHLSRTTTIRDIVDWKCSLAQCGSWCGPEYSCNTILNWIDINLNQLLWFGLEHTVWPAAHFWRVLIQRSVFSSGSLGWIWVICGECRSHHVSRKLIGNDPIEKTRAYC